MDNEISGVKSVDELAVGDLVRSMGQTWRVTEINGDNSINFENIDASSPMTDTALVGKWKERFYGAGFEIISAADEPRS